MAESTLLDQSQIMVLLQGLCDQIVAEVSGPIVLVGIREGGDVMAERLANALRDTDLDVEAIGALDITLYRDDFGHRDHWPDVRASDIPVGLEGKTVVLVDDVIFTGRTIRAALNALLDYGRPERILLAVLIDRGNRQLPVQPDIVGKSIDLPRDTLCIAKFREQGAGEDCVVLTEGG